ncbi:hypothetical protein EYR27_17985 [Xanthomonas oryzae]|nr:hypothetical protein EYR27_17985 [Xanthomonas oryzae]
MDAATELTWTYVQRVPRWWAGKGPAASAQIIRSAPDFPHTSKCHDFICCNRLACANPGQSKARCPNRARQLVGDLVKLFCCSAFVEKETRLRIQRAATVIAHGQPRSPRISASS